MHKIISILGLSFKVLFSVCLVAVLAAIIPPKWEQWQGMQKRRDLLNAEIKQIKSEIFRMQENQQRFKTDRDFVEQVAREKRRVQPGELVFIFDDDTN